MSRHQTKSQLDQLLKKVREKALGNSNLRMEYGHIPQLQVDTGLGERTLKRLFGLEKAPMDYLPQVGTRNLLAQYAGYEDWAAWVRELSAGPPLSSSKYTSSVFAPDIGLPNAPFRGLAPFRREDARIFFGRKADVESVLHHLDQEHRDQWIFLYGQSGVGKSSFLQAGLIPQIELEHDIHYLRLEGEGIELAQVEAWYQQVEKKSALLIIDQAENIWRPGLANGQEQLKVLQNWKEKQTTSGIQLSLVIAFRKEFYADFEDTFGELEIEFTRLFLHPLDKTRIMDAIEGVLRYEPARLKYQLAMENGISEAIAGLVASDTGSPVAPTLQIILTQLWEQASTLWPPKFTWELLQPHLTRGVILEDFLSDTFAEGARKFPEWSRLGLIENVLLEFVTPQDTARARTKDQIEAQFPHVPKVWELCLFLQDQHLLTETQARDREILRLAHDALGPHVRSGFNRSPRPGPLAQRILEDRLRWQGFSADTAGLDSRQISILDEGQKGMRAWTATEKSLVVSSKGIIQRQKRRQRINRAIFLGGSPLVLFLMALVYYFQGENANAQELRSQILLEDAREDFNDGIDSLPFAIARYTEIMDIGHHRDSVFKQVSGLVQEFLLWHHYTEIQGLFPLLEEIPEGDSLRQLNGAEIAFFAYMASDWALLQQSIAYSFPDEAPLAAYSAPDSMLRESIQKVYVQYFGKAKWRIRKQKYFPRYVAVPPPLPNVEYPPGVREEIRDTFYLAATELTNISYLYFLNTYSIIPDSNLVFIIGPNEDQINSSGKGFKIKRTFHKHPCEVSNFLLNDLMVYFKAELPSRVEWLYAARGGPAADTFRFSGSDDPNEVANYRRLGEDLQLEAVAQRKPNSLGFYDMSGNAYEAINETARFQSSDLNWIVNYSHIGGQAGSFIETGELDLDYYIKNANHPVDYYQLRLKARPFSKNNSVEAGWR